MVQYGNRQQSRIMLKTQSVVANAPVDVVAIDNRVQSQSLTAAEDYCCLRLFISGERATWWKYIED